MLPVVGDLPPARRARPRLPGARPARRRRSSTPSRGTSRRAWCSPGRRPSRSATPPFAPPELVVAAAPGVWDEYAASTAVRQLTAPLSPWSGAGWCPDRGPMGDRPTNSTTSPAPPASPPRRCHGPTRAPGWAQLRHRPRDLRGRRADRLPVRPHHGDARPPDHGDLRGEKSAQVPRIGAAPVGRCACGCYSAATKPSRPTCGSPIRSAIEFLRVVGLSVCNCCLS